jgi:hypothetical protein
MEIDVLKLGNILVITPTDPRLDIQVAAAFKKSLSTISWLRAGAGL